MTYWVGERNQRPTAIRDRAMGHASSVPPARDRAPRRSLRPAPACGLGLLLVLAAAGPGRADERTVRDVGLAVRVRQVLLRDERLAAFTVGVTVRNGSVTLWGT